jgi:hypothetical protein
MAQKEIITYDGVKYQKVVLEEIGNTGHYKEISRTSETVLGILDDALKLQEAIEKINAFRASAGRFVWLHGDGYFQVFTVIQLGQNNFENLSQGVLSFVEEIGYVTEILYEEKKITIKIIQKANEDNEVTLLLEPYDDLIYQIKE